MNSSSMSKNMKGDLALTKFAIIAMSVISVGLMLAGPRLIHYVMLRQSPLFEGRTRYILLLLGGYVSGFLMLYCLYVLMGLVKRIGDGDVFVRANVNSLNRVSLIILTAAVILLFLGLTCITSMVAVSVMAAFMTLIVRGVRDAFLRAVEMQDELDYTI